MIKALTMLLKCCWQQIHVHEDWRNGVIVKVPKKGNLADFNNWRGITLLSVPGKVLCTVLLERLRDAVDEGLREQRAGFRKRRSCCKQSFILRNIIEQCTEQYVRDCGKYLFYYCYYCFQAKVSRPKTFEDHCEGLCTRPLQVSRGRILCDQANKGNFRNHCKISLYLLTVCLQLRQPFENHCNSARRYSAYVLTPPPPTFSGMVT